LAKVNSAVEVEPVVADVTHGNIADLAGDVDVIVDGTDNFATRFLVNDFAVKHGKPWVYGGAIGAEGQSMTIVPGETACLACLMPDAPPPGATPTCDTAGILAPAVGVVASLQSCEAIKLLSGNLAAINRRLTIIDLWGNHIRQLDLGRLRDEADCRVCKHQQFDWLAGHRGDASAVLCGRNAVQLCTPSSAAAGGPGSARASLDELAARLAGVGTLQRNPFLLRLSVDGYVLTVFADGRTIVSGTNDIATARTLHARYIGA
jgi:adenylyltransferase/sulfurtransferase